MKEELKYLTLVVQDKNIKVAQYGHYDGDPERAGMSILSFIRTNDMAVLAKNVQKTRFFKSGEIKNMMHTKTAHMYPSLDRNLGWRVLAEITNGNIRELESKLDFAADSLMCEWGYLLDLDNQKLEIYTGFTEQPLKNTDRFYFLSDKSSGDYYPIRKVAEFPFDALPARDEFLNQCYSFS